jgi:hypothetical protein
MTIVFLLKKMLVRLYKKMYDEGVAKQPTQTQK